MRADLWYVWFPDGRVLRAAGAGVVRQQLEAGRLPLGTRARRSGEEQWRPIEAYGEFSDLAANGDPASHPPPPATIASRIDPAQMGLIGVRAYVDELFAALDSTLVRSKLVTAAFAGLVFAALAGVAAYWGAPFTVAPPGWGWLLVAGGALVLAGLSAVLTNLTYVELTRLRPARWREGIRGAPGLARRLAVAWVIGGALVGGLITAARALPGWALDVTGEEDALRALPHVAVVAGTVLEVCLWPLLVLLLPLGAVLAVEQRSFGQGLARWARLLRDNPGRLLFAEGLALSVAFVVAVPFLLVLWLAAPGGTPDELLPNAGLTRRALLGLVGAFLLAYLTVAQVFLYLHLRQGNGDGAHAPARKR